MCLGLLPTRYRVALPSRSCNLTSKLLPCFMIGYVRPAHALYGPAPVEFDLFARPHHVLCFLFLPLHMICTRYVVCSRYLIELFFATCPSRLLLSMCVLILKEYQHLRLHFEDCVGRRETNTSGGFLELAPSSAVSIVSAMFVQLCPFPTPGIPYFARLTEQKYIYIKLLASCLSSITTPSLTFCVYASRRPAAFQAAGEAPCTHV